MKKAIELLCQYGEKIIQGDYQHADIAAICEATLNKKEAQYFVGLITPFLSLQGLHHFNAALLGYAMAQDAHKYLREQTGNIIKQLLIFEARQHTLFNITDRDMADKLAANNLPADFYLQVNLSEPIKDHFANIILPATKDLEAHRNNPEKDLTMRFYFNIVNPVILDDLLPILKQQFALLATLNLQTLSNQFNAIADPNRQYPPALKAAAEMFMKFFYQEVVAYQKSEQQPALPNHDAEMVAQRVASFRNVMRSMNARYGADDDVTAPVGFSQQPALDVDEATLVALTKSYNDFLNAFRQLQEAADTSRAFFNNKLVLHGSALPKACQQSMMSDTMRNMVVVLSDKAKFDKLFPEQFNQFHDEMTAFITQMGQSKKWSNKHQVSRHVSNMLNKYGCFCALANNALESVKAYENGKENGEVAATI